MPLLADTALVPLPDDPEAFHLLGILAALASMICWVILSRQ